MTFHFLVWTCMWISLNGCVFYKTIPVPVNSQSLKEHAITRPLWTIENANKKTGMFKPLIRNDTIVGKLSAITTIDHPVVPVYRTKKGRQSLLYLHLNTASPPVSDSIKIPISGITSAAKHVDAPGESILATLALTAVSVVGGGALLLLILCNCPSVSAIGTDTTQFQGSLFPGAISKSLERSDNLIMKGIPLNHDGKVNLRVSNELPETEYLNYIELFEVRDLRHTSLGQHALGHPVSFNAQGHLLSAVTPENRMIKNEVQSAGGGFYDFNEQGNDYELNKVFLTFNRSQVKDDALLIVRAKQSKWMESVAAFFLQQFGTGYDRWVDRLDKTDPKKYRQDAIDRGISMNAYVKIGNQWDYLGSFENIGTSAYRDLALNLDLSKIREETVEIKLEVAHGLWDIDYAGLTDEWSTEIITAKLNTISAVTGDSRSVVSNLLADDRVYAELPTEGSLVNLLFDPPSGTGAFVILRGKGYYHHQRNYTSEPNYKFLKAMERDKLTTHHLSRLLQGQLGAQLNKTNNP